MNIFNRPPSIAEDTLQYIIHPPPPLTDSASCTSLAACIHALVSNLLPDFLWHRDPFQIKVIPNPDGPKGEETYILEGRMRVGDSIDDEWCTVWLLREISKQWDVAISVVDSDGEFLLIEAAEFLPAWVNPSNAINRVWIHRGSLHLVPLPHVSSPDKPRKRRRLPGTQDSDDEDATDSKDEQYIAVEDALALVRDTSIDTLAPKAVENTVWQRISGYPGAARTHMHTTKAYLPIDIARALSVDSSLVQKPIEGFYTRDAIQLRAARRMARFPPRPNVLCSIKMTRTAYAQLTGQKFFPPKIFGKFEEREGTANWRWRDIGMKLACGFEMLFQESKNHPDAARSTVEALSTSAEARKEALRRAPDYKKYLSRLVIAGYFRNETEGSQLWNELENSAAEAYVAIRRVDDTSRPSFASLFNAALSRAPETFPETDATQTEDSDEWMNVDAASFDDNHNADLKSNDQAVGIDVSITDGGEAVEDKTAMEQTEKLHDLAARVERFVEGEGSVEGAMFEDEAFSDNDADSDDGEEGQFSDERFSASDEEHADIMEQQRSGAARQEAMANLVPALPSSEYGQMPASFNTQRVAKITIETETVRVGPATRTTDTGTVNSPPRTHPIRPPILPRDRYDGVDSDDESSSSDPFVGGDEEDAESEEDQPQVVGDIDVNMDEEETEFLEFSRQALGISDNMWRDIVEERRGRGAFVPASVTARGKSPATFSSTEGVFKERSRTQPVAPSAQKFRTPVPGPRPHANPNLDSFEAVMQAMDAELSRSQLSKAKARREAIPTPPQPQKFTDNGKGKALTPPTNADMDMDTEAAMDAELKTLLEEDVGDSDREEGEPTMDYNLIKNFLESFKSQGGLSGPVGNLAGRLKPDWSLPRDET
ncbi:SGT1-domain-containing protein [Phlebopus sp. FC_14]|nr:SGT1-domain-containing protein [Phlebopus sp. FC_14]